MTGLYEPTRPSTGPLSSLSGDGLRVAVLTDALFLQRTGGLQRQAIETVAALQKAGVKAAFFDPGRESLDDYDLAHVFDAENGNDLLIKVAGARGLPVVVSSVMHPVWTVANARRARLAEWLTTRLSGWKAQTTYERTRRGLVLADRILALTEAEKQMLVQCFGIDREIIDIVPNGITSAFFTADPTAFRRASGIDGPFVLCVATITPRKNQETLATALRDLKIPVMLIGPHGRQDEAYLARVRQHPQVVHFGPLSYDDPLLPSAYAAAAVFALPSLSEVMPITVFEALAAGTPVVVTNQHAMDLPWTSNDVCEVDPRDIGALRQAVQRILQHSTTDVDRRRRRDLVAHLTWTATAQRIAEAYERVTAERRSVGRSDAVSRSA